MIAIDVSAETLKTPGYWVSYDDSWVVKELNDPPRYELISSKLETKAVFSSLNYPKGKDLNELSDAYLKVRIKAEKDALKANSSSANIQDSKKPIHIGYQIEYWGTDSENRNFRYWSVVTDTKIVNIYIESYKQDPNKIEEIFRSFLKSLKL